MAASRSATFTELAETWASELGYGHEGFDLQLQDDDERDSQYLVLGIEREGILLCAFLDSPGTLRELREIALSHLRLVPPYTAAVAGPADLVHNLDDLLGALGCPSQDSFVDWLEEEVFGDEINFWFNTYDWTNENRTPPEGRGLEFRLSCHGFRSLVCVEFPLAVSALKALLGAVGSELEGRWEEDLHSDWWHDPTGDVFKRFPFLIQEAEDLGRQLSSPGSSSPDIDLRRAQEWAGARMTRLLNELPAPARSALDLDQPSAVVDLRDHCLSWAEFDPSTEWDYMEDSSDLPVDQGQRTESPAESGAARSSSPPERAASSASTSPAPHSTPDAAPTAGEYALLRRPHLVPALGSALLLLLAPRPHPYDYYVLLRWAVSLSALLIVWVLMQWRTVKQKGDSNGWEFGVLVFAAVAAVFNPLLPVTLDRDTWFPIDCLAAVAFAASTVAVSRPNGSAGR